MYTPIACINAHRSPADILDVIQAIYSLGMPVQDACAELQRGLARLKRIAASNAKDAIFLSQVGCSRSQWHAAWGVSGPCCITVI